MTPLLERQPAAGTGTHIAPRARADEQLTPSEGAFVCRTCSRRFPSFQALGGHRTGHTRLQKPAARAAHECAVCGLEFAMGQALGDHMRRHKQQAEAPARAELEDRRGDDREGRSAGSGSDSEPRLLNLLV